MWINFLQFATKRLIEFFLTLFAVTSLTFVLIRFLPGSPFDNETLTSSETRVRLESQYGLNASIGKQYINFVGEMFSGNWGESYKYPGTPISEIIREPLKVTVTLGLLSLAIIFPIGGALGFIAASKYPSWISNWIQNLFSVAMCVPSFILGPLLVLLFSFKLDWLPPALLNGPSSYILPALTLSLRPIALVGRLMSSSLQEVFSTDYIRTAKAKGLTEIQAFLIHGIKNSLIPLLSLAGPMAAAILSGSFVIEMIYALPGTGKIFIESIMARDFPMVVLMTFIYSIILLICQFLSEILMGLADPRIRVS